MAPSVGLEPTWTSRPTLRFLVGAATITVRWHMAQAEGLEPPKVFRPRRFSRPLPHPAGLPAYITFYRSITGTLRLVLTVFSDLTPS